MPLSSSKKKKLAGKTMNDPPIDLITKILQLNVFSVPFAMFSMKFNWPCILFVVCNEAQNWMVVTKIYVQMPPQSFFISDIINNVNALELHIQVSYTFVDENYIFQSNAEDFSFDQDAYEAQAFKDICKRIDQCDRMVNTIFGNNSFVVNLPFICECWDLGNALLCWKQIWRIFRFPSSLNSICR